MPGGDLESLDQRFADPAVILEVGPIARRRQAQQSHAVGKAAQVRLVLGDGAVVELGGEHKSGIDAKRRGPGRIVGEQRTELLDLGDQPLLDMVGSVGDEHRVA
jgi:hypothetical protein